jgi:phage replication-related protein YjqB (UPF0714/DUF867 family)
VAHGFTVGVHDNPELQGNDPLNICNRGGADGGVQLELSNGFRLGLFEDLSASGRKKVTARFGEFVAALREGLPGEEELATKSTTPA